MEVDIAYYIDEFAYTSLTKKTISILEQKNQDLSLKNTCECPVSRIYFALSVYPVPGRRAKRHHKRIHYICWDGLHQSHYQTKLISILNAIVQQFHPFALRKFPLHN
jgi:hypothetical protein